MIFNTLTTFIFNNYGKLYFLGIITHMITITTLGGINNLDKYRKKENVGCINDIDAIAEGMKKNLSIASILWPLDFIFSGIVYVILKTH